MIQLTFVDAAKKSQSKNQTLLKYKEWLLALERALPSFRFKKNKKIRKNQFEEILVQFVDDKTIRKINTQYRKIQKTTDVLSFSYSDAANAHFPHEPRGEIFISTDTAEKQAAFFKIPLHEELMVLTIHGLLHILGYDHETSEKDKEEMRKQETKLLKKIGITSEALTER
ncbi:MAG TPA: rRNA maturation RNase YbeY [Turneriella sp.]|nr:rRNA maturation RNase YbeY [Turneriella sp.]